MDTDRPITAAGNSHIRVCAHCHMRYDWRRSPSSSLKMTYCGTLCERAALGFTIDALLQFRPSGVRKSGLPPFQPEFASVGDGDDDYDAEALVGRMAA